jgi:hypothetical protein
MSSPAHTGHAIDGFSCIHAPCRVGRLLSVSLAGVATVPISKAVQRWWPLPDSLDLVRGPVKVVASAVLTEVTRFVAGGQLSSTWVPFSSLDQLFGSVEIFTNVPTVYFVLPTRSDWTVLWNYSFLCVGLTRCAGA